jgi:ADP-ribose pyrophosphatase YjhB (NUDIX family)
VQGIVCDRCQGTLLVREDVRYEVKIQVKCAYDPMELDLDRIADSDVSAELARLARVIEDKSADELEAEVFKEFQFDLCLRCQRDYLKDPIGAATSGGCWHHHGVGLVVHDEALDRLLLQQKDDGYLPGPFAWSFFGGGVEPGEAAREALLRELAEEWEPSAYARIDTLAMREVFDGEIRPPRGEPFRYTLFALTESPETIDALAATRVREGLRAHATTPEEARRLRWIWGLDAVLNSFLGR